jgi:hypothetical protein
VQVLVDLYWLREVKAERGGRPSLQFVTNPRIWDGPHGMA